MQSMPNWRLAFQDLDLNYTTLPNFTVGTKLNILIIHVKLQINAAKTNSTSPSFLNHSGHDLRFSKRQPTYCLKIRCWEGKVAKVLDTMD